LSAYVTDLSDHSAFSAVPTTPAANIPVPPPVQAEKPDQEVQEEDPAAVTEPKLSGSVARVEYRDQNGNVLDESLVASLRAEGKVKFETRYESKRLENGHEIPIVDGQLAPPHPDVEGQNPETGSKVEDSVPPESPASVADGNERSVEQANEPVASPASEGNEATK
jgi:dolichyl-phosphate-mannose-protein mannosyltransferase